MNRPWHLVKVYGSYENRSTALKAEYALKHGKRGESRARWSLADSSWYRETEESASFTKVITFNPGE